MAKIVIMATIMYMRTLSLAEARAEFSKIVSEAQETHERFDITKNGERAAVLLSADEYDSLIETLEIMADPQLVAALARSRQEVESGDVFKLQDVIDEMKSNGKYLQ